ncbi:hypothetical protein CRT60_14665 [Azospirillum palustre]|uniref:Uncharacterized protein n=1 Tax=Azospirillum palustre TaxID=2044885 RepID=A0A2B8BE58_9PROT|nr:hypothetical protein CRT60_14665 [Azospirillum palustre]
MREGGGRLSSDLSPSPPRGEGRGEGDAPRAFHKNPATRPPHPNPLPRGERESSFDCESPPRLFLSRKAR